MGATKKENKKEKFSPELLQRAELFKILGNPARLKAIEMILAKEQDDDLTLEELRQATELATSTLSYHLKMLKKMCGGSIKGNSKTPPKIPTKTPLFL